MPTYVYKVVGRADEDPSAFFEVLQSMAASPLEVHPETGEPVERVICAPALGGKASPPPAGASAKPAHSHGAGCGCH